MDNFREHYCRKDITAQTACSSPLTRQPGSSSEHRPLSPDRREGAGFSGWETETTPLSVHGRLHVYPSVASCTAPYRMDHRLLVSRPKDAGKLEWTKFPKGRNDSRWTGTSLLRVCCSNRRATPPHKNDRCSQSDKDRKIIPHKSIKKNTDIYPDRRAEYPVRQLIILTFVSQSTNHQEHDPPKQDPVPRSAHGQLVIRRNSLEPTSLTEVCALFIQAYGCQMNREQKSRPPFCNYV